MRVTLERTRTLFPGSLWPDILIRKDVTCGTTLRQFAQLLLGGAKSQSGPGLLTCSVTLAEHALGERFGAELAAHCAGFERSQRERALRSPFRARCSASTIEWSRFERAGVGSRTRVEALDVAKLLSRPRCVNVRTHSPSELRSSRSPRRSAHSWRSKPRRRSSRLTRRPGNGTRQRRKVSSVSNDVTPILSPVAGSMHSADTPAASPPVAVAPHPKTPRPGSDESVAVTFTAAAGPGASRRRCTARQSFDDRAGLRCDASAGSGQSSPAPDTAPPVIQARADLVARCDRARRSDRLVHGSERERCCRRHCRGYLRPRLGPWVRARACHCALHRTGRGAQHRSFVLRCPCS